MRETWWPKIVSRPVPPAITIEIGPRRRYSHTARVCLTATFLRRLITYIIASGGTAAAVIEAGGAEGGVRGEITAKTRRFTSIRSHSIHRYYYKVIDLISCCKHNSINAAKRKCRSARRRRTELAQLHSSLYVMVIRSSRTTQNRPKAIQFIELYFSIRNVIENQLYYVSNIKIRV